MTGAAEMTSDEALTLLAEGDDAVRLLVGQLSEEELNRPRTMGGGAWSVKDLLGHLTQWEEFALEAVDASERGTTAPFQASSKGVDELNADATAAKSGRSLQQVRAESVEIHGRLVGVIRGMSEERWRSRPPSGTGERATLAELLGGVLGAPDRPFGHAFAHLPDLEAYVRAERGGA